MDTAYFHQMLGNTQESIEILLAVANDSPGGEADLQLARLHETLGNEADSEFHLQRALARTPYLALEVADDPALGMLRERPAIKAAISRAFRELDRP